MTKWNLFSSMVNGKTITIEYNRKTYRGLVNKIEREDGSGHNFIVTLHTGDSMFVRTVD